MKNLTKKLFGAVWIILVISLVLLSLKYRNKAEALTAIVESQETAISYQKPVIVNKIFVAPGQEVSAGDTLITVSQPSLELDVERKVNELSRLNTEKKTIINDHNSKIQLLSLERDGKVNRLTEEKNQIQSKLNQQKVIKQKLLGNEKATAADSVLMRQFKSIVTEIDDVKRYFQKEIQRQQLQQDQELEEIDKELDLTQKEYDALMEERLALIKVANFHGIVATADVQLNELVPPYKKVVSIYEYQPTVIKAFMNERYRLPIKPGEEVKVVSENRLYETVGTVMELGARITSYPTKIQPEDAASLLYGQEIFIKIPEKNNFLNGEKVFVYPKLMLEK